MRTQKVSYTCATIKTQQKQNDMKKQDRIVSVRFSGSGHYKVTISKYGKRYTSVTTDMPTIDDYKDGKVSAAIQLYDEVIRKTSF